MLRPKQQELYRAIKEWRNKKRRSLKYVINSTRRFGKSTIFCVLAAENHIKKRSDTFPTRIAAPTEKGAKNVIRPINRWIYSTAPSDIRPKFLGTEGKIIFPWESEIHISGVNMGHEDDLRGTAAGECYVDEAGMVDQLDYLVEDVLMPQLLTTGGDLIMASTPPRSPAHVFVGYMATAQKEGNYAEYDIEHSDHPKDIIEQFIEEAGGRESTTCQREYFCQCVVDKNFAIIPEWQDRFIQDYPREKRLFQYFHKYESMDIGGRDKTAILLAYYDFPNAKLIVEDELIHEGPQTTTKLIAETVVNKEFDLWGLEKEKKQDKDHPRLRVADNNNVIMLQDLGALHGIHFLPTQKDNLQAMVNQVRMWVMAGRLIVDPRCKELIGCLKYGIWNEQRTEFARSQSYGHFDALASLIYLVRNIDESTNPIPENWDKTEADFFIEKKKEVSQDGAAILSIFAPKKHGVNFR